MKILKALRLTLALIIAALILDAACFQNISNYSSIEIPVEGPVDEDVTDDSEDDKMHSAPGTQIRTSTAFLAHYTTYLINHTHQVQETFSPPPEA